jgi:hypothetical protein
VIQPRPHLVALLVALLCILGLARGAAAQQTAPPPTPQNPTPLVEHTRAHERLEARELPGTRRSVAGPLGKPVRLFIPENTTHAEALRLVIHFHGAAPVAEHAASQLGGEAVVATVQLGAGSGIYDRAFSEPAAFRMLLEAIRGELRAAFGRPVTLRTVTLTGFSAGYGAIRAILREPRHFPQVDAVLLLDGLHTSYLPEGMLLEKGGRLDEERLEVFVRFARAALRGEKRFLITHSEIFPGTFASTTETTDHLIEMLQLKRTPVLRWGPRGMQQLSESSQGRFVILGFAGNSAPDHIDHLHGMPEFLRMVESFEAAAMK